MIKYIFRIVKRIIMAIVVLYGINIITANLDFLLPINIITIVLLAGLGLPGLGTLIALYFLI